MVKVVIALGLSSIKTPNSLILRRISSALEKFFHFYIFDAKRFGFQ